MGGKKMLECRKYEYKELSAYMGTRSPSGIKNRLRNYEVEFTTTGRGNRTVFDITAINNPFKVFAVFDLQVPPQTDHRKFAYFVYLVMTDNSFCGMSAEMMEEHLRDSPHAVSRQTIAHYLTYLAKYNLIAIDGADCIYYRVYKKFGVQTHDIVSREEYARAWKVYWECKNEKHYDTFAAYRTMYNFFGGVPRKQSVIGKNGIYNDVIQWIVDILIEDYGKE